jgi:hypothetical protein
MTKLLSWFAFSLLVGGCEATDDTDPPPSQTADAGDGATMGSYANDGSAPLGTDGATADPGDAGDPMASPSPIEVTAPVGLQSARVVAQWKAAAGAAQYDVILARDAACADRVSTATGVVATQSTFGPLATGLYFLCVVGKSATGATVARTKGGHRFEVFLGTRAVTMADAPAARVQGWSGWSAGRLFVWGGFVPNTPVNRPFVPVTSAGYFDEASATWLSVAAGPSVLGGGLMTPLGAFGSTFCTWGGRTTIYFNTTGSTGGGCHDVTTKLWTPINTAGQPSARAFHFFGVLGSRLVVFGGETYTTQVTSYDNGGLYDPASKAWTVIPSAGLRGAVGVAANRLVVFDGTQGKRFDPSAGSWSSTAAAGLPMNTRACRPTATTGDSLAFVARGPQGSAVEVVLYDPVRDTWRKVPATTPSPVCGGAMAGTAGALYFAVGDTTRFDVARLDFGTERATVVGTFGTGLSPQAAFELRMYWADTHLVVWDAYNGKLYQVYPTS